MSNRHSFIKPSLLPLQILLKTPLLAPLPPLNLPVPTISIVKVMAIGVEAKEGGMNMVMVLEEVVKMRTSSSTVQLLEIVNRHQVYLLFIVIVLLLLFLLLYGI